jgi:peptide/nickel transport system permease protein
LIAFVLRRLLLSLLVLVAVSYGTFILIATQFSARCSSDYTPQGAFPPLADGAGHATTLWLHWLTGVPSGKSFGNVCGAPVTSDLWDSLGHTMALLGMTVVIVLLVALVLGVLSAVRAGGWFDLTFRAFSYVVWAIPGFLLALALQAGVNKLNHSGHEWFPLSGWPGACSFGSFACAFPDPALQAQAPHGWEHVVDVLHALVVPSFALAFAFIGLHSRYLRSSLLGTFGSPYITTARAKGLSERRVVLRHALRNSLSLFTSLLLLDMGAVIGASLAVDWVFKLNGLGLLFLGTIGGLGSQSGDGPKFLDPYSVMALLTLCALLVALSSLLAEIAVVALDPRVRPS